MNKFKWTLLILLVIVGGVFAQRRGRFGGGWRGGDQFDSYDTPRQIPQHVYDENGFLRETPMWTNTPGFDQDVFTFVRIKRNSGGWGGGPWSTDTPDSDLNLSWRLSTLTALKVNPDGRFLRLTDRELLNYPFIYMAEPGSLVLDEAEAEALRKYLLNGGFLWLDDFWGENEWNNVAEEFKKVFPGRDWVELPLEHPLYHCVFDIKSKGQVPNVEQGSRRQFFAEAPTWEKGGYNVHHRALFDDQGRIMAFATHNTDNGDGWEWEGNNHFYFEQFAEKIAYPLAINVIFYTMTH
ncbi:MAG: DUF4159 domain-containing protein [Verrucomicrobiota bacterium]